MSLQRRREWYVILHLWKIWQGAVPNDLDIQFYDHTRLGTRCKIPAIKRYSTTLSRSIYDHSFAVRGPKLWNAIPKNIKCAPCFEVFKSKLTSHLMSIIPDLPPVPGYTTPNCRGGNLRGVNCRGVNCRGVNCRGVNYRGVNCRGVNCRPPMTNPQITARRRKIICSNGGEEGHTSTK